jgi:hypothetical protein
VLDSHDATCVPGHSHQLCDRLLGAVGRDRNWFKARKLLDESRNRRLEVLACCFERDQVNERSARPGVGVPVDRIAEGGSPGINLVHQVHELALSAGERLPVRQKPDLLACGFAGVEEVFDDVGVRDRSGGSFEDQLEPDLDTMALQEGDIEAHVVDGVALLHESGRQEPGQAAQPEELRLP